MSGVLATTDLRYHSSKACVGGSSGSRSPRNLAPRSLRPLPAALYPWPRFMCLCTGIGNLVEPSAGIVCLGGRANIPPRSKLWRCAYAPPFSSLDRFTRLSHRVACAHTGRFGGRTARAIPPMPVSKGARSHRSAVRPRLSHKHSDQRKRAGGNQTKGTDDEKSQEDREFLFAGLRRHQRSRCTLSIKICHGLPLRSRLK